MLNTDPPAGDLAKAHTLPASWYRDPAIYERERHAIFAREWLVVGRASQVAGPGDYVATEIAGWNVFVMRGEDGVLRGFHNVCRHRAGPLVWDGAGTCANLICRYHGWAYDRTGCLRSARDFGDAADFDPDEYGLLPVQADIWGGLVWVNLDLDAAPLELAIAAFAAECDGGDMAGLEWSHEHSVEIDANWKNYADNYMEGYHIPLVHPELNRQVDARRYQVLVGDRYCNHVAPARDGAIAAGKWLWRFPTLALGVYGGGMEIERFIPLGPHRTRVTYDFFFTPGTSGHERREVTRVAVDVLAEDKRICEVVQRNLDSGAYDIGRLSPRHENGVWYLQQLITEALEGGPPA